MVESAVCLVGVSPPDLVAEVVMDKNPQLHGLHRSRMVPGREDGPEPIRNRLGIELEDGFPRKETADLALEFKKVNVRGRMLALGCDDVYLHLYGPLSNVAHNGYSAMTCQMHSRDTGIDEPVPEISADSDHFLVQFGSTGFIMTFQPIPARVARARYMPMVATVVGSAAVWLAGMFQVHSSEAVRSVSLWLSAHGVSSYDLFPRGTHPIAGERDE